MKETIIVTGGAGFIGANFVRSALAVRRERSSSWTGSPMPDTDKTWRACATSTV